MSSRKLLVIMFVVAFVAGTMSTAHAKSKYLTALSAACTGTSCTSCHPSGGPPPFTAYGTSFDNISSHSSNPSGAIATLGCPGGTPTPVACTGYTYSAWSACGANGQQTRTVTAKTPSGCTGTPSAPAVLTQACTPAPVACTGYTYSAWSACGANGQQTRTVTAKTPSGCTGTPSAPAVLTQACTPAPAACTGYTYSAWSACGANGQQTRTVTAKTPSGCTGTPSASPVLTQACSPSPVACTSFTYGAWTVCDSSGHQTRTATGVPAGCTGTANPAQLTQVCNYVPPVTPPPTTGKMPVPTSEQVFSYQPVASPVVSSDPAKAEPIGVGSAATGGSTLDIRVKVGPFAGPVNVSLIIYAPVIDFEDLYFMRGNELKLLSDAVNEDAAVSGQDSDSDQEDGENSHPAHNFGKLVTWRKNVTGVDENLFTGPAASFPSGLYTMVLVAKSPKDDGHSYRWVTHFAIP